MIDNDEDVDMVSSVGTANSSGSDSCDTEKERRLSTSELRLVTLTSPARKRKQECAAYTSPLKEAFMAVEQLEAQAETKKRQYESDPFKSSDDEAEASDEERIHEILKKYSSTSNGGQKRLRIYGSASRKKEAKLSSRKSSKNIRKTSVKSTETKKVKATPSHGLKGDSSNERGKNSTALEQEAKPSCMKTSGRSDAGSKEFLLAGEKSTTQRAPLQSQMVGEMSDDTDGDLFHGPQRQPHTHAPTSLGAPTQAQDHSGLSNDTISSGTPPSPSRSDSSDDSTVVVVSKTPARDSQHSLFFPVATTKNTEYSPEIEDDSDDSSSSDSNDIAKCVGHKRTSQCDGRNHTHDRSCSKDDTRNIGKRHLDCGPLTEMTRNSNHKHEKSMSKKRKLAKLRPSGPSCLSFTKVSRGCHT